MANIDTYLNEILSAIYGEEVRGSIVNALRAQNSETESTTANANEAIQTLADYMSQMDVDWSEALANIYTAITNADTATSNADTATANANTATANANAAADAAYTAAVDVEAATASANTAAASANTAASAAQSATSRVEDAITDAQTATATANSAAYNANSAAVSANTAAETINTATDDAEAAADRANAAALTNVQSISYTYQGGDSGTTPPEGEWSDIIPHVESGHFLWVRILVTYYDESEAIYYNVSKMGSETGVDFAYQDDSKTLVITT